MLMHVAKWLIGIPLGATLYLYDDLLWGPAPIAIASRFLGWPTGFLLLCLIYFIASFTVSYLVLKHYENKKPVSKKSWLAKNKKKRRGTAHNILLTGKWIGLAISCFTLGAMVSSVIVGKFKLFDGVSKASLAFVMSFLFVFLFMGFYGGVFGAILEYGLLRVVIFLLAGLGIMKILYSLHLEKKLKKFVSANT
jgi:hypothetical protein